MATKLSADHQIYPLRIPIVLRQTLQRLADDNRRSLAKEIVYRLEQVVKQAEVAK